MKLFISIANIIFISLAIYSCSGGKIVTHKQSYPIWVWADESEIPPEAKLQFGEYKDPWQGHPCGVVRKIDVSKVLPYGASDFIKGTERVIEFDENGEVIGSWAMPVDSWVMALDGDSILVSYSFDSKAMSIARNGNVSLVDPIESVLKLFKCPKSLEKKFGGSAYKRCVEFRDIQTGQLRFLVYEMPCT